MVRRRRLEESELTALLDRIERGEATRIERRSVVQHLLQLLVDKAPGGAVEVRVPPFAAVQAIPGTRHTRGTPPAVVEMDADTWIALARGRLAWSDATKRASGERSDLSVYLPLVDL